MNKPLDLSEILQQNTLEIIMLDKSVIHLKTPSFKDYLKLQEYSEKAKSNDKLIFDLMLFIMNSNSEGKVFSKADIEELSVPLLLAILNEYMRFAQGIVGNPTMPSQAKKSVTAQTKIKK